MKDRKEQKAWFFSNLSRVEFNLGLCQGYVQVGK